MTKVACSLAARSRRGASGRQRRTLRLATAAAVAFSSPLPVAGQSYVVHSYTTTDGLPGLGVHALAQDGSGTMWFATRGGIASYDGDTWTVHADPVSPPARDYTLMRRDERGTIWAASHRLGRVLARPPGGEWSALPALPRRPDGLLLASAFDVTYDRDGPVVGLGSLAGGGLHVFRGGSWRHVGVQDGLPGPNLRGIAGWRGQLFVVTPGGLARVAREGVDAALTGHLPPEWRDLRAVAVSPASPAGAGAPDLWVLGRSFLGVIRGGEPTVIARGIDLGELEAESPPVLLPDPPRSVYIGSPVVLLRVDLPSRRVERLGIRNGLANDRASGLLLDREGNLWVAGPRGVSKLVSRRFGTYRQIHGLLSDEVTAIGEPRPGVVVLGHNAGLSVFDGRSFQRRAFPTSGPLPLAQPRVVDLQTDEQGNTWFIALGRGLGRLGPDSALTWFRRRGGSEGLETSLLVEPDGSVWVATRAGVLRFDGRRFEPAPGGGRIRAYVRRMTRDRTGTLYLATTAEGVLTLRDGVVRRIGSSDDPGLRSAFAVREDRGGRLWVGTQAGLFVVTGEALARPDPEPLRFGEPVFFIAEDPEGDLWLGTDRGVLRWDGSSLRRYTPREGLAGWETNRAAGFVDSRGRVWIGTEAGVSVYRREEDGPPAPPPLVEVGAIETAARRLPALAPVSLPHHENSLTFRFRAVSFLDERAMSVRCFLEGFEAGWSSDLSGRAREARYTNLPPGRYRFRVKAANAAGVWSAEASSGPVVIRRPPWTEWWFALLAGGAGAALLAGVIKAIVRWRYAEKLESEVAKRTAALRESESRYRQLFDDPSTAKLLVDPDGPRVVDANEQGRLLAKTPGPLVGRGLAEAGIAGLEEPVRWAAAGREGSFLVQAGHTPGGTRELEVRTSSIALAGRPYVLVTAQDVTARRRLEEERIKGSKLESLGVLAGGLAHDFNNLLMAVLSHVSLARQRAARGRDVEASLAAAETALMRASGLTAQLLTFAKGGAPVRRLTELGPLLRETAGFVLAGARSTCLFELPEVLWPAEVDGGQIGQLIGNILLNASQAMPAGGRVSIEAANLELEASHGLPLPPGPYVRISIADEGVGIPPELLDRIFDPYFTTKEGGQGLGLASCHSIVRRHGGHMRIDSTPGRGTTVTVWLPAAPGIRVEGEVEGRVTQRGQGRILAVDDELVVREAYGELLHELGYEPVVVPDGAEAVRRYAEAREEGRPFRAVLLDLTIRGGMGGKETLDELRRQDPAVRAIVASGYSSDPLLSSYREAGFDGMLSKPFGPELLSKVLREVLERPGP